MATQKSRNVIGFSSNGKRISRFSASYYSNRESGQVVKRQSPCEIYIERYTRYKPSGSLDISNESPCYQNQVWNPFTSQAYGRAYRKFQRLVEAPGSEVLLTVMERRKSLDMISARVLQLSKIVNAVKRGRLGDAWDFMSLNPHATVRDMLRRGPGQFRFKTEAARQANIVKAERWRQTVKEVGNCVLEINYGWLPLKKDIESAVKVLSEAFPESFVKAASGVKFASTYGGPPSDISHINEVIKIVGKIRVSNPHLDLANRLGLLNWPSVAYEMIPFSFLLDWVLPLGTFLKSFTDFVGLELIDGSVTGTRTSVTPQKNGYRFKTGSTTEEVVDPDASSVYCKTIKRTVVTTLPRPPLMAGTGLNPTRAMNAVALLLQALNPRKGADARSFSAS